MSKEQTPIMPKEYDIYLSKIGYDDSIDDMEYVKKCLDELVNAKVLEALEREVLKSWEESRSSLWNNPNGKSLKGIDYFKTEVKPKYKL